MLLKRLEMRGFKSFADATVFEFDRGVTGIIGPNGSGKSNISDAIRWALGEQSMRSLRGKRTEDVIFAGSSQRSSVGMAEVSLTFDNADGGLDVPFSEVVVTRRAYRSGENEYLINRERVRHRDLIELLQKANITGNGYTVIGQGMVDMALSLKADERRDLLEEAADIKRYRSRLADARQKLGITQQNMLRANDLVAEVQPRLTQLEAQAKLLRQHQDVSAELAALQRQWLVHQWNRYAAKLVEAEETGARVRADREVVEAERQRLDDRLAALAEERRGLAERARVHQEERQRLAARQQETQRALAVLKERQGSAARQLQELEGEWAGLEAERQAEEGRVGELRERLEELVGRERAAAQEMKEREAALAAQRERRREVVAAVEMAQQGSFDAATRKAELQNRLASLRDRTREGQREQEKHRRAMDEGARKLAEHQSRVQQGQARIAAVEADIAEAKRQREEIGKELEGRRAKEQDLLARQADVRNQLGQLRTRLDLLSRLQASRTGYYGGVKAVLDAGGRLNGIVGIVAALIKAPSELETAVEMALGSHMQDVVVQRWADAEAAIEYLKCTGAGRATFLPLDTIRAGRTELARGQSGGGRTPAGTSLGQALGLQRWARAGGGDGRGQGAWPPPQGGGALGIAAELVRYEPTLESVAWYLLGRTFIVDNLQTARGILRSCPPGWLIVTLQGDLVRPGGAVTGGSRDAKGSVGLMARERELRELPEAVKEAEAAFATAGGALTDLRQETAGLERRRAELEARATQAGRHLDEAQRNLATLQREGDRLEREITWWRSAVERLEREEKALVEREAEIIRALAVVEEEQKAQAQLLTEVRQRVAEGEDEERAASAAVSEAAKALAVLQGEIKSCRELLDARRETLAGLDRQLAGKRQRQAAVRDTLANGQAQAASMEQELAGCAGSLEAVEKALSEIEGALAELQERENEARQGLAELGKRAGELEGASRESIGEATRWRQELDRLRQQVEGDEGLVLPESYTQQLALPLDEGVEEGAVTAPGDPEETKRRVDELKGRLRALGMVNPRAIAEYEETKTRHAFLVEQVTDLERASAALQKVIGELEKTSRERFEETFETVARRFSENFRALFGGGTARLVLNDQGDSAEPGVDIIAQPPGKRPQSLGLLSGGERALTAAALIFGVLQTVPTPFAVLDEVDAALDDTNVVRFCRLLTDLAQKTQFIIITHNRSTMDIADTIYGVSMGEARTSRILSLKLTADGVAQREAAVGVGPEER